MASRTQAVRAGKICARKGTTRTSGSSAVVAIVGAGPVGLAALITAQFYSPAELILVLVEVDQAVGRLDATVGGPS
jgi:threonine dehydrogenase-like Zn-dependent dehydrogenase